MLDQPAQLCGGWRDVTSGVKLENNVHCCSTADYFTLLSLICISVYISFAKPDVGATALIGSKVTLVTFLCGKRLRDGFCHYTFGSAFAMHDIIPALLDDLGPVYMEKSCPGQEGHPPSRVNFTERLYEKKVDPSARAKS